MGTTHSTTFRHPVPRAPVTLLSASNIDFNDAKQLSELRRALMASEAVQRFCDLHFDGVNVAASKRAFIDLKLYYVGR